MLQIEHSVKYTVHTVLPDMLALPLWTDKLSSDFSLPNLISYISLVFHVYQYTCSLLKLFILTV